jgi:hypothetical protein
MNREESVKLLLDEHIWEGLAQALRDRGHDVKHINHTSHRGIDDESLLDLAAQEGRAILTNNHRHFAPLFYEWLSNTQEHSGIILSVQLTRGELIRQTENLLHSLTAADLYNNLRWLQEFK